MPDFISRVRSVLTAAILVAMPAVASAQVAGSQPVRWTSSAQYPSDFEVIRDTTVAHGGGASIRVRSADEPRGFTNVSLGVAAQPYIGHRIRFSVFFRTVSLGGAGAMLWARADDANHKSVAFLNTYQTAVRGTTDWAQVSLSLDIPSSAIQLYIGALTYGPGTLWLDDARVEADGVTPRDFGFESPAEFLVPPFTPAVPMLREAARALSTRGLANVTAFTQALGYVRFFHPSPEAVRVNWDAFAVHAIRAVEAAPTPDSLASTLRSVFAPIAPEVMFARTGAPIRTAIPTPSTATHAVFWRHEGVGVPTGGVVPSNPQSVYRSDRVTVPLADVGRPLGVGAVRPGLAIVSEAPAPDPSKPLVVAFAGGVTASIPLALFTTNGTVPDSLRSPRASAVAERFTASDRATRLADVALAWSLFQHFYPYFDVVRTDWEAARAAALQSAATDRDADAFQVTLERLVAALHDGHGNVFRQTRQLAAPDVQLGWAEGRVFVTAVGDTAAANGVRRGDELLAVDNRRVDSLLAEGSSRASGATPQWIRTRALGSLLVGDFGSSVQLRLRGSDNATRESRLVRRPGISLREPQVAKIADVAPGVMYVDLGRITDDDFTTALPRLGQARAIIFDMRGYPRQVNTPNILSHLTDTVIHSAHFETPIITLPDHRSVGYLDGAWTLQPRSPRLSARVVFLSAGGAISYAESTLGVVEAYRLGDIVGEPSAGTNGNVNPFELPGGYTVSWTGMLVQKRDGTPHHGVGVVPTVPVSTTAAGLRAGRDEILERAIALVTPRPATP